MRLLNKYFANPSQCIAIQIFIVLIPYSDSAGFWHFSGGAHCVCVCMLLGKSRARECTQILITHQINANRSRPGNQLNKSIKLVNIIVLCGLNMCMCHMCTAAAQLFFHFSRLHTPFALLKYERYGRSMQISRYKRVIETLHSIGEYLNRVEKKNVDRIIATTDQMKVTKITQWRLNYIYIYIRTQIYLSCTWLNYARERRKRTGSKSIAHTSSIFKSNKFKWTLQAE